MNQSTFIEQALYAAELARDFVSQTAIGQARSFMGGDAQFFAVALRSDELREKLDSPSVSDKRDAMKRIVAQMCKGNNMRHLYPDVVRNIHVKSIEVRKLIYHFVVYYAADCPDEALLSIAAFQKDLANPSMHVRALALRMLCSLRIPAIHPAVMMAVRKCSDDVAPLVRKTAAVSLVQMYSVCGESADMDSMLEVLDSLLDDTNADVVGAAAMSFCELCPTRIDRIHPLFRHLCRLLGTVEEWGQIYILRVLLRYARSCFTDPNAPAPSDDGRKAGQSSPTSAASSGESASSSSSSSSSSDDPYASPKATAAETERQLDPDHRLLLQSVLPLLRSLNSAVVVGAVAVLYHCAPTSYLSHCAGPLLRLYSGPMHGKEIILAIIQALLKERASSFASNVRTFYLLPMDSCEIRRRKLDILARLATASGSEREVLREFAMYVGRSASAAVTLDALGGLSTLADQSPHLSASVMRLITPLLTHRNNEIVSRAVRVLRLLAMRSAGEEHARVCRLIFRLVEGVIAGSPESERALTTIVWLTGENIARHPSIAAAAPDLFRTLTKRFTRLPLAAKQETLALGVKIWVHLNGRGEIAERFKAMFLFVLELSRYDDAYTIRDQSRLALNTLDRDSDAFAALKAAAEAPRPTLSTGSLSGAVGGGAGGGSSTFELGSLSFLLGRAVLGHEELPPWCTSPPDPSLRGSRNGSAGLDAPGRLRTLSSSSSSSASASAVLTTEGEESDSEDSSESESGSEASSDSSRSGSEGGSEDNSASDSDEEGRDSDDSATSSSSDSAGSSSSSRDSFKN